MTKNDLQKLKTLLIQVENYHNGDHYRYSDSQAQQNVWADHKRQIVQMQKFIQDEIDSMPILSKMLGNF